MKLTDEEEKFILEKRMKAAELECPEIPRSILDDIIRNAESMPACRDGGRSIKRSIAQQAAYWGFGQQSE